MAALRVGLLRVDAANAETVRPTVGTPGPRSRRSEGKFLRHAPHGCEAARVRLLALLLLVAPTLAFADAGIRIGPAITLDPTPAPSTQLTLDGDACIANGLVWTALRSRIDGFDLVRLTPSLADGGVLDPVGRSVASSNTPIDGPRVACGHGAALVVSARLGELIASRFTLTGMSTIGVIANSVEPGLAPTVAATTTGFLIVWQDRLGTVRGRRLSPLGQLLDVDGGVALFAGSQGFTLDRAGASLAVAQSTGFQLVTLDPNVPVVTGTRPTPPLPDQVRALSTALGPNGSTLTAFTRVDGGTNVFVSRDGVLLGLAAPVLASHPRAFFDRAGRPAVVVGEGSHVALYDLGGIPSGGPISARQFLHRPLAAVAADGVDFVLSTNDQQLNFGWLQTDAGVVEREGVGRAEAHQFGHDLTGTSGAATVVYRQLGLAQNANQDLKVAVLSATPQVTTPATVLLTDCCSTTARIASRPFDLLLMRRVLTPSGYEGEVLSVSSALVPTGLPSPLTAVGSASGTSVAIATTGTRALAVWRNDAALVVWRLTAAGPDLTSAQVIPSVWSGGEVPNPVVASLGQDWWLSWTGASQVFNALVSDTGPLSVRMLPVAFPGHSPSLTGGAGAGLLTYASGNRLLAARVFADGGVVTVGTVGTTTSGILQSHHVAIDGGFVAAFSAGLSQLFVQRLDDQAVSVGAPQQVFAATAQDPRLAAFPEPVLSWRELEGAGQTWRVRVARLDLVDPPVDAGPVDAGADAGSPDAGLDGGALDAGHAGNDGGLDGGTDAGGAVTDAGDTAEPDAGGTRTDAGPSAVDAGSSGADPGAFRVGCGCSAVDPLVTLGLIWLLTRRRRPSDRR
jgi:hypothetical protein